MIFQFHGHRTPYSLTQADGAGPDATLLHDHRQENTLIRGNVVSGAPDSAMVEAAHVVTGQFETSYVEHAYIEPEAGVAWMEADVLCIQACTQAPVMDLEDTAKVLGLPLNKVRIIPSAAGGGFGAKLDVTLQPLLGLAVLKTGMPCRMVFSRSESMQASTKRHPGSMQASIGADAGRQGHGDDIPWRFQHRCLCQLGPNSSNPRTGSCLWPLLDAELSRYEPLQCTLTVLRRVRFGDLACRKRQSRKKVFMMTWPRNAGSTDWNSGGSTPCATTM
jgi:hypothetical protein